MGRRPVANAEKKIFKEIVALSKTHTVNKISTLDIAARMHLSETIIYSRFSSKKILMKNAFFYCIEELEEFSPFRCTIDSKTEEYSFNEFILSSLSIFMMLFLLCLILVIYYYNVSFALKALIHSLKISL